MVLNQCYLPNLFSFKKGSRISLSPTFTKFETIFREDNFLEVSLPFKGKTLNTILSLHSLQISVINLGWKQIYLLRWKELEVKLTCSIYKNGSSL